MVSLKIQHSHSPTRHQISRCQYIGRCSSLMLDALSLRKLESVDPKQSRYTYGHAPPFCRTLYSSHVLGSHVNYVGLMGRGRGTGGYGCAMTTTNIKYIFASSARYRCLTGRCIALSVPRLFGASSCTHNFSVYIHWCGGCHYLPIRCVWPEKLPFLNRGTHEQ